MSRDLSEDARRLLAAFAAATDPTDWYDVVLRLAPEPRSQVQGYGAWLARRDRLVAEVMLLFRDGMLVEVEDAVDMTVITQAGREALAAYPTAVL